MDVIIVLLLYISFHCIWRCWCWNLSVIPTMYCTCTVPSFKTSWETLAEGAVLAKMSSSPRHVTSARLPACFSSYSFQPLLPQSFLDTPSCKDRNGTGELYFRW